MSGFLLDTDLLSDFSWHDEPDRPVKQWLGAADTDPLYASLLTFGEIRLGVELLPPSKRHTQVEEWLDRDLPEWFEGRILPVDQSLADRRGWLRAQVQMEGRPASVIDAMLAATGLEHNLTIVSRNVSDFAVVGLTVVKPLEAPSP
jgi:predicted nucleic acid-binding protein